jgi:hypothetical protein
MNVVPIGIKGKAVDVTLTSVSTSEIAAGDIITNDKVAINEIMAGTGQSVRLKRVQLYIYDSAGSPVSTDMDLIIFTNLASTTLGLSSNDVFVINANNLGKCLQPIPFTSWDTVDTNIEMGSVAVDMIITPDQSVSNSLSFVLVCRETVTITETHTIIARFEAEQL